MPMLDGVYDFELDEELKAGEVLEDILMLLVRGAQCSQSKSAGMALYAVRQERILNKERSLQYQGVRDGDRLILI